MGPTPLYDSLKDFAAQKPLRLHMPGHKGGRMPLAELDAAAPLDFTELEPTGGLFAGEGAVMEAQALWARAFSMEHCLFLTGGSTQGMLAALTLAAGSAEPPSRGNNDAAEQKTGKPSGAGRVSAQSEELSTRPRGVQSVTAGDGGCVLLDRGSHRSAYHALALLDLTPVYLDRPWLPDAGVFGPVSPQDVEALLKTHPEIKTICITSPTYYGVLSDIPALSAVVHQYGGKLVVDAAHGAHLPFLGYEGYAAADLVVTSAHKTLPALGQGALLFAGKGAGFSHARLRWAGALYGSSSPSYLIMASLDGARAWMEEEGKAAYSCVCQKLSALRAAFPSLSDADAPLDPARFILRTEDGFSVQRALEAQGIYPEMADSGHVVFIFSCADGGESFDRLTSALDALPPALLGGSPVGWAPPPPPEVVLSPRRACFSPMETAPLSTALGRVSACQVAPYPPGVPIVAPGERISKKHLAYLTAIGYNMWEEVQVVAKEGFL